MTAELRSSVAVIPARGGSKRIPRKNIRSFRGTPLLARTIAMLQEADVHRRIVVSTDDDEVADVARDAGAEVPFVRPAELSDDHAGTRPVVVHALRWIEEDEGTPLRTLCTVYPAAVFVRPADLREAHARLDAEARAEFVFSAAAFPAPVQRAVVEDHEGWAAMMQPEHASTRSQDLEPAYHDAGQFYVGRRDAWLSGRSVLQSRSRLHVIPHWRVQDIDTPDDWVRAELLDRLLDAL